MIRINIRSVISVIVGLAVALMVLTNYRFNNFLGYGELAIAIFIFIGGIAAVVRIAKRDFEKRYTYELILVAYTVLILLPLTLLYSYLGVSGSSVRDWFAFLFGALFLLALAASKPENNMLIRSTIIFILLLIALQYFFGGERAWYQSARFTGGATNPNQLGLYMVCCLLLIGVSDFLISTKVVLITAAIYFGLLTKSDAFLAYLIIVLLSLVVYKITPRRYAAYSLVALTILLGVLLMAYYEEYAAFLVKKWSSADEGGGRVTLYLHGIDAWLSSVFTFFLGNGAGSFSGLDSAYQQFEAHNTPIDMLTIGGVVGFILFYYLLVRNLWISFLRGKYVIQALLTGLIAFSMFHFVARHPIYWLTMFAVAEHLWHQRNNHRYLK